MDGRDDRGRFVKGHSKTGGRLSRPVEEQYRDLFKSKFTPDKMEAIFEKLHSLALKGDLGAIKLILEYLLGKPVDRKEFEGITNFVISWDENNEAD